MGKESFEKCECKIMSNIYNYIRRTCAEKIVNDANQLQHVSVEPQFTV